MPRKKEFNEHVNNHQVIFSRAVSERHGNIIVVEDIERLGATLDFYDNIVSGLKKEMTSNNEKFCKEFKNIVDEMLR